MRKMKPLGLFLAGRFVKMTGTGVLAAFGGLSGSGPERAVTVSDGAAPVSFFRSPFVIPRRIRLFGRAR
jgi:hypothetical protein